MWVDQPRLWEFSAAGFCLFGKLSESIKGLSVNDFFINMALLIGYDKCFILLKSRDSNRNGFKSWYGRSGHRRGGLEITA